MELTPERKHAIRDRIQPLLAAFDPELKFIQVFLDSERTNLGVVVQKDEQPILLRFEYVRFISMPDSELRAILAGRLKEKRILSG